MQRVLAVVVVLVTAAGPAAAEESEADRLFEEGRKLLVAGRAAEACPKFERSQELDPGRGTLINLAACYEELGKLIEALATFEEVVRQSEAAVPRDTERLAAARKRIDSLRPKIPRLAITAGVDVTITVAGTPAPPGQWSGIPVNPGEVEIVASAEGFEPWRTTVTTAPDGKTTAVEVPALTESGDGGDTVDPVTFDQKTRKDRERTIAGISIAGGGAVLFGVSVVLALGAKGDYDDALDTHCGGNANTCNQTGLDETAAARKRGNLATVVGGVGVVAVAAGVVLWLTAPTETYQVQRRGARLVPQVTGDGAGFAVLGTF